MENVYRMSFRRGRWNPRITLACLSQWSKSVASDSRCTCRYQSFVYRLCAVISSIFPPFPVNLIRSITVELPCVCMHKIGKLEKWKRSKDRNPPSGWQGVRDPASMWLSALAAFFPTCSLVRRHAAAVGIFMQAVRSTAHSATKVLGGQTTAPSGKDPVKFNVRIRPPIMTAWSFNKLMQERRRYGRPISIRYVTIFETASGTIEAFDTIRCIEGTGSHPSRSFFLSTRLPPVAFFLDGAGE